MATKGEVQSSSRQIADIIGVIDSIVFLTNTRAGLAGEVRSLAQCSAVAARDIKAPISSSVAQFQVA